MYTAKSFSQKGGWISNDTVLERIDNQYWKIEVGNFQSWMLSFTKFVGEWETAELEPSKIQIDYRYTMHSSNFLIYPLCWLFTKLYWKIYMKRVIENIRKMIENEEPYLYM